MTSTGYGKWKELEHACDPKLVQKTPFKQDRAFFGFVTNDEKEYKKMNVSHAHIVLLRRDEVEDTKALNGSNKFHQIRSENSPISTAPNQSKYDKVWLLNSSNLLCSCPICSRGKFAECPYRQPGGPCSVTMHRLQIKRPPEHLSDDVLREKLTDGSIRSVTNAVLKANLVSRGFAVPTREKKENLVNALRDALSPTQLNNDNLN